MSNPLDLLQNVSVVGIGLHPYQRLSETPYVSLALHAIRAAIDDAGLPWPAVDSAHVANTRIGMAAGMPILRYLGSTGLAVAQVENASASGSTAFRQAVIEVASGMVDVAIAIGVDKPEVLPTGPSRAGVAGLVDQHVRPVTHFGLIAERYLADTGATPADLAAVSVKNHRHGSANPYAQRPRAFSLEEVLGARPVSGVLTSLQCTPVGEGAAAVIVASDDAIGRLGLDAGRAVRVRASVAGSERYTTGTNPDLELTAATSTRLFDAASCSPDDIDVVELHDAFSVEELIYAESMGFAPLGDAAGRLRAGDFDIGGKHAFSPSGGLLAMGHPIGPTGVGQIAELTRQLRGEAGPRQHPGARLGLAHMVGVGAVCIMHLLERPAGR